MLKLKNGVTVPALTVAVAVTLALFAWSGKATEEAATEECRCAGQTQERLNTLTTELGQMRQEFQAAKERIGVLEKSLTTTERQAEDLQRQNLNLQEGRDMAHEDIDLMRAEMRRCAGDRAHLDDVATRYQASQAQLYDLHQRLQDAELSVATLTRERDNLQAHYDWIKTRLDAALQENSRLRLPSYPKNTPSGQNSRSDQR
ncbi:exported hypothetical protein [Gammaproteobacteria bacterium]